jgi:DNA-binding transcriptional ArsR family regulator
MAKGVGKALEAAISPKEKKEISGSEKKSIKFEFMNANRREIFQYLCIHPCSYSSMISRATSLSLHTVNWHLRRLLESEYVSKFLSGKKTVFYPTEMISLSDIPILELLNTEKARAIYIQIAQNNGIFQKELCGILQLNHQAVIWYTKKLELLGLITSLEDGKYKRYYPTQLLKTKKNENEKRMKQFQERLQDKFQRENLHPSVIRSTNDKLVVRISQGSTKAVLTLSTNPFVSVLS